MTSVKKSMRLLILGCSMRKRPDATMLPVLERYNGPTWQVLRAYLRGHPIAQDYLDVYALSAQYGLIPASQLVGNYDRIMTATQVAIMQPQIITIFHLLMQREYQAVCLGLSRVYLAALGNWQSELPHETVQCVTITNGPEGTKLRQLSQWLKGNSSDTQPLPPQHLIAPEHPRGKASIHGVTLTLSPDEVLTLARQALILDPAEARKYRDWYVLLDEMPVGPKWLVSRLTGLSPVEFQAETARRFLVQLGISTYHVAHPQPL